ncbi:hypothetical protein J3R82DRAFT_11100 [Butyriboletus roseoflavus]|nr:hypothetical protein J3R82DRAFT_11100 [Butyriboletus roseoflavus]
MTLPRMKNLKFRQLGLSETSMYAFIALCPNLTRLDVSFTRLHRLPPSPLTPASTLEKLSLTSTALSSTDIVSLISTLPNLRTLYLGALGSGQGSSASIGNISAMTMTDDTLTFPHGHHCKLWTPREIQPRREYQIRTHISSWRTWYSRRRHSSSRTKVQGTSPPYLAYD